MKFGSEEHRKEYFTQTLPKEINQSLFFLDLQLFSANNEMEKLRAEKAAAEMKLENKEYSSAGDGRKVIKELAGQMNKLLLAQAGIEGNQLQLRERLEEVNNYAKAKGWEAE